MKELVRRKLSGKTIDKRVSDVGNHLKSLPIIAYTEPPERKSILKKSDIMKKFRK